MDEEIVCAVCLEAFKDPVRLPCSHIVCRECVEAWIYFEGDVKDRPDEESTPTKDDDVTLVPVFSSTSSLSRANDLGAGAYGICHDDGDFKVTDGLDEFFRNHTLNQNIAGECNEQEITKKTPPRSEADLRQRHQQTEGQQIPPPSRHQQTKGQQSPPPSRHQQTQGQQSPPPSINLPKDVFCEFCNMQSSLATKSCQQCQLFYCDTCFTQLHPMRGPFATHSVTGAGESQEVKPRSFCKKHNKMFEVFCTQCKQPVCYLCALVGEHKGHECQELHVECERKKVQVKHYLTKLQEKVKKIGKEKKTLEKSVETVKENSDKLCEKVKRACTDIIQLVQKREKDMICRIKEEEEAKLMKIEEEKLKCVQMLSVTEELVVMASKILEEKFPVNFLMEFEPLSSRVDSELCVDIGLMGDFADHIAIFNKDLVIQKGTRDVLHSALSLIRVPREVKNLRLEGTVAPMLMWDRVKTGGKVQYIVEVSKDVNGPYAATQRTDLCKINLNVDRLNSNLQGKPKKLSQTLFLRVRFQIDGDFKTSTMSQNNCQGIVFSTSDW